VLRVGWASYWVLRKYFTQAVRSSVVA
jgi:hypothetical protein